MEFEHIIWKAQEGDESAIMEIVEMYRPLLIKKSIVEGRFDEDLYQELMGALLFCIRNFHG
ncbi:MAG: helix-turn-helix domain-containing protein [Hespellia sp.]|nr:helix-turn-helix domain-containing protein [Hespellia sp.]